MSESTQPAVGRIFGAIPSIMAELEAIGRNRRNEQQRFMYRGIDDLYNALQPLLAKHRVFTVPSVLDERRSERPSKSGGVLIHAVLRVQYRFYADDGSFFDAVLIGEGMDSGDKGANKAESVAHKYALTQVFAVRTEDQVEPDAESPTPAPKKSTPKNEPAAKPPAKSAPKEETPEGMATEQQRKAIWTLAKKRGWDEAALRGVVMQRFGKDSTKLLTTDNASGLIKSLQQDLLKAAEGA